MEDMENGIRGSLSSLHLNSIMQLFTMAYKLCETELHKSFLVILLLEVKQYNYPSFEPNVNDKQSSTVIYC